MSHNRHVLAGQRRLWDPTTQSILWTEILRHRIHRNEEFQGSALGSGKVRCWSSILQSVQSPQLRPTRRRYLQLELWLDHQHGQYTDQHPGLIPRWRFFPATDSVQGIAHVLILSAQH